MSQANGLTLTNNCLRQNMFQARNASSKNASDKSVSDKNVFDEMSHARTFLTYMCQACKGLLQTNIRHIMGHVN